MNDIVALFDANKIKSIEFYRSEMFGVYNEEIWCEIDLLESELHKMTLYRKGYTITSNVDRMDETTLPYLLKGQGLEFYASLFKETKTKVFETTIPRRQVCELIQSVSYCIGCMQSLKKQCPPMEPSPYYPERKVKHLTDKNKVLLNFTDETNQLIEMHLDSETRKFWARPLKIIPELYRCFFGPSAIKKISKNNLKKEEIEEVDYIFSAVYPEKELEFILEHMFRDEHGDAYFATSDGLELYKILG